MASERTKKCIKCGPQPVSHFTMSRGATDGLQSVCKACRTKAQREYRAKNKVRNAVLPTTPAGQVAVAHALIERGVITPKQYLEMLDTGFLPGELPEFEITVEENDDEVLSDADILEEQAAPDYIRDFDKSLVEHMKDGVRIPAALKRVLIIPDTHVPYEDARAVELMLKVARAWGPDTIVILGDFGDFYSVSSHDKRPDRVRLLDVEVAAINARLTQIDALGATEKYFIAGNHEDRLERYLMQKAPELFNMVKVRDLFKLTERGWKYTPYKESLKLGKLNLTHDCGNAGAQAHTKALSTFQHNVVLGHTHRAAIAYEGNAQGEPHVGAMFGWLGDVSKIDYMHQIQALRGWQTGFGVGYMEPNGVVHLQIVPIVDYRCVLEGVLYAG